MKKAISLLLVSMMCFVFTACGKSVSGKDVVEKARKDYEKYDSATILITDVSTGDVVRKFSFAYNDDKSMAFSYYDALSHPASYVFNDGKSSVSKQSGKVTTLEGEDFTKYTKKEPHQNATKDIFFYLPDYIGLSSVTESESGENTIYYNYNVGDFPKALTTLEDGGVLSKFETTYYIDAEGKITKLTETSTYSYEDKDVTSTYEVELKDVNSLTEITNDINNYDV